MFEKYTITVSTMPLTYSNKEVQSEDSYCVMGTLFFLWETWSQMSAVSGYGNLYFGFKDLLAEKVRLVDPKGLWIENQKSKYFLDKAQTKIGTHKLDELFPWVDQIQRFGCSCVVNILTNDRHAAALLSAGEDQLSINYFREETEVLKRLFVVFHQPASWHIQTKFPTSLLQKLGGVVCLSLEQASYFKSLGLKNVILSRHGVDHNFFAPGNTEYIDEKTVLVVGRWMRDFALLEKVMPIVWRAEPRMRLRCVGEKMIETLEPMVRLSLDRRVEIFSGISAVRLRELYRRSSVTFLPLSDAVANNTILEAVACCCPIVVSDLPSTREYLSGNTAYFAKHGDAVEHANALINLISNPLKSEHKVKASVRAAFVQKYDWRNIAKQLIAELKL